MSSWRDIVGIRGPFSVPPKPDLFRPISSHADTDGRYSNATCDTTVHDSVETEAVQRWRRGIPLASWPPTLMMEEWQGTMLSLWHCTGRSATSSRGRKQIWQLMKESAGQFYNKGTIHLPTKTGSNKLSCKWINGKMDLLTVTHTLLKTTKHGMKDK